MNLIKVLVITSILTLSGVSFADTPTAEDCESDPDYTLIGSVPANNNKEVMVPVAQGEQIVEIWAPKSNNKMTCRFYNDQKQLASEQKNTTRCGVNFAAARQDMMKVVVVNGNNKTLEFRLNITKR